MSRLMQHRNPFDAMDNTDELKEFFAAQKAARCPRDRSDSGADGLENLAGAAEDCRAKDFENCVGGSETLCAGALEGGADAVGARRFKCVVAYDGTDFCGWQSQAGGGSVQDFIEFRLRSIFKKSVRIHGSGRTDAGVHANAQVFHFDAVWRHSTAALLRAMRSGNTQTVRVLSLDEAESGFHARFSAVGKRYVYRLCRGFAMPDKARYRWSLDCPQLDLDAMRQAAKIFMGAHDFKAYSANRNDGKPENTVKTISKLEIAEDGGEIAITVEGDGFLYKMVRMLVGALVQVGRGKLSEADLQTALQSKKRGNLIQAAPAQGLFLDEVFY